MIVRHPYRAVLTVVGAMMALFLLSASGQPDGFWSGGPSWLGALGWGGFLVATAALLGLCGYLAMHRLIRDRRAHHA